MSNLTRDETRHRAEHLRVQHYHVELDLREARDPAVTTFGATTSVRLTSRAERTWLDFLGPRVRSVTVDGAPQPVRHHDGRVAVDGLRVDGTESVVVVQGEGEYSRTGEGLHRFVDPVDDQTYLYTQYEPADARRVFADFEQPDLKAPCTFVVTAPGDWQVLSNSTAERVATLDDGAARRWVFAPTPIVSSYLTAVVAGPYHRVEGHWSGRGPDGEPIEIPLGVWCGTSLAPYLDAEEILEVTCQGLEFFHDAFGYPYPWGKYDQVFVPEYNLGAMENPGLVTFTERHVFRSQASRAQREGRATTILHEMTHMWFGDLATMRWWDDLWLKESFADYMGTHAATSATRFTDAWTSFALHRKAWAYRQDQLPTTHPVVADIPDLEAAKQNFDGITYAKGAAVLKQLVAYVGEEAFFAGAREYFRRHAYGSTTLPDLLGALEEASGRDLGPWSAQWLQTCRPSTLTAHVVATDGCNELHIEQTDEGSGEPVLRDHRLVVGLYSLSPEAALQRTARLEVEVTGALSVVPLDGATAPDLMLVNDDDLSYAKVRLDPASTEVALRATVPITESLSRAVVWSALWNAARTRCCRPIGSSTPRSPKLPARPTSGSCVTCWRTPGQRWRTTRRSQSGTGDVSTCSRVPGKGSRRPGRVPTCSSSGPADLPPPQPAGTLPAGGSARCWTAHLPGCDWILSSVGCCGRPWPPPATPPAPSSTPSSPGRTPRPPGSPISPRGSDARAPGSRPRPGSCSGCRRRDSPSSCNRAGCPTTRSTPSSPLRPAAARRTP